MKIVILKLIAVFGPVAVPSLILLVSHLFFYQPSKFAILAVYLTALHGYLCSFLAFQLFMQPRAENASRDAQGR